MNMTNKMDYRFMSLSQIRQKEPDMKQLKVSEVARSPRGFLTAYKRANGNPDELSDNWINKRRGFIARTLPSYDKKPTPRRKLALQAWAYNPKRG
jgi:hypothetical protein